MSGKNASDPCVLSRPQTGATFALDFGRRICKYNIKMDFNKKEWNRAKFTWLKMSESVAAAAREIGLEASADKTKYVVMSRDQNAGRIHSED